MRRVAVPGTRLDNLSLDRRGLVLAGAALAAAPAFASIRAGQVDELLGEAIAEAAAQRRALASGASLFMGDTVETGNISRLAMTIGTATRLKLGPVARLRIDRYLVEAGGMMSLQAGAMLYARPPAAAAEPMQIRGAFGMIAVRGTEFFAGPSRGKIGVFVARGSVTVTSGGSSVTLGADQGTDIAEPGAGPTAPAIWSRERVGEALALFG